MKKKIVIATHGNFAEGIYHSLEMILGEHTNIERICTYVDADCNYQEVIKKCVTNHDYENEDLIVITDIMGGSVNNEFMKYIIDYPFMLITGLNLPLLLEIVLCPEDQVPDRIREIVRGVNNSIIICNDLARNSEQADNNF